MKVKNTHKVFSVLMVMMLLSTSCEKDFLDVNDDPNNPSSASVDLVFPAAVNSAAFTIGGQWQILGAFWSQHWTQSTGAGQFSNLDRYEVDESTFDLEYSELYSGALNDLYVVSTESLAAESWNYFLMSEIMSAYTFQVLVDLYDKVPYFEAFQGAANLTPAFNNGDEIYDDLIVRIDNALAKDRSVATATLPGNDDLLFQGDMDQWVRFANTLKLKIYMRQSEARPTVAQAGIEGLFNSGALFLEVDVEMAQYIDVENFRNPYHATQVSVAGNGRGNVDVAASNTLLNTLLAVSDPRVDVIYNTPIAGGGHVGLDQGDYSNPAFVNHNNLSQPAVGPTHPVVFISASESKFLQAEAVVRYGVAGDAKALYEQGIEASFLKYGVAGASGFYGPGDPYEYQVGNEIEAIIFQKWISMANYNGLESHFEYLRTGFPDIFTLAPNNVTTDVFPKRLPFPSTETTNNTANLDTAGGQKLVTQRVWWDNN